MKRALNRPFGFLGSMCVTVAVGVLADGWRFIVVAVLLVVGIDFLARDNDERAKRP